jgi:hypothetical protein
MFHKRFCVNVYFRYTHCILITLKQGCFFLRKINYFNSFYENLATSPLWHMKCTS